MSRPRHARRSNYRLRLCRHRAVSSELPVKSRASVTGSVEKPARWKNRLGGNDELSLQGHERGRDRISSSSVISQRDKVATSDLSYLVSCNHRRM